MHSNTILKSPAVVPLSPQRIGALYSAVATKANEETILCLSTERSVVLYFRWINENCTLEMLLDKKSDGFEDIEAKLANEVTQYIFQSIIEASNRTAIYLHVVL